MKTVRDMPKQPEKTLMFPISKRHGFGVVRRLGWSGLPSVTNGLKMPSDTEPGALDSMRRIVQLTATAEQLGRGDLSALMLVAEPPPTWPASGTSGAWYQVLDGVTVEANA